MSERKNAGSENSPQIQQIMKALQISEAEAKEVLEYDRRINAGEKLGELSAEQKKVAKEMTITRAKTAYKFQQREKKTDAAKQEIIAALAQAVRGSADEITIINAEREFTFAQGGKKYKIVLSCPRS